MRVKLGPFLMIGAVSMAACSEGAIAPSETLQTTHAGTSSVTVEPTLAKVEVCKEGTNATFDVAADEETTQHELTAGECRIVFEAEIVEGQTTPPTDVTVTEIVPAGVQLDKIEVVERIGETTKAPVEITDSNSTTVSATDDKGYTITFFNSEIPPKVCSCDEPSLSQVNLCKDGTDADFDVEIEQSTTRESLTDGECRIIFEVEIIEGQTTPPTDVKVTEIVPAGVHLDMIEVIRRVGSTIDPPIVLTGTTMATVTARDDFGFILRYTNSIIPPPEGEGCTPGYWKQPHHFDSWTQPFDPTDLFGDTFDLPSSLEKPEDGVDPATLTLVDALRLRGGKVNALIRHAVAALLNAAHPDVGYGKSTGEVVTEFNAAIGGGDISAAKDTFSDLNEQGCPLN